MIKRAFLFVFLLTIAAPFVQAEPFSSADLEGTWNGYVFEVNPTTEQIYWIYGYVTIDSLGDVTDGSMTAPTGDTVAITTGESGITIDGTLDGFITSATGLTGTVVDGVQDQGHSLFSYVSVDTDNALSMALGLKQGGSYTQSDLTGNWRMYGLEVDPTLGAVYWLKGDAAIDATGTITSANYSVPTGLTLSTTSAQAGVDQNGKLSGAFTFDNGLNSTIVDGTLDMHKSILSFVSASDQNHMDFVVGLKKGGSYKASDLVGNWKFYNFTIDSVNELVFWIYGSGAIDSAGNLTGTYNGPDGSSISVSNGQMTISSSGEISGSFTIEGGAVETINSGFMDKDKTVIVFVGTSDNGQIDFGIGFKTGDSTRASLRGDISYNGTPVCAMILANGKYMFTCSGDGSFSLTDVPYDASGNITVYAFCSGLAPYKTTLTEGRSNFEISMSQDQSGKTIIVTIDTLQENSEKSGWADISGTVENEAGTPLCAMVLANGQHMFSCGSSLGTFDLTVPLDGNGNITLYVFCSGLGPYKEIINESEF